MSQLFSGITEVVDVLQPVDPIHCVRTDVLRATARRFVQAFPGDVLYAVKCNDNPVVLNALHEGGIRHFDTASITEIRDIRARFPAAECHYMHPIKSPDAIAEAYYKHGVRAFVLDHEDELAKILEVTHDARDLTLVVRLEMPRGQALMDLSGKFGAPVHEAARLLKACHAVAAKVGLTFHVGSQCVDVRAFGVAIDLVGETLKLAGCDIDVLDVGGGFPGQYTGNEPAFEDFCAEIRSGVKRIGLPATCRLQCEPGRALVWDALSVLCRVDLRRGASLYLNDGTYGSLSELKYLGPYFPITVVRPAGEAASEGRSDFQLFGPTCDSVDSMPGPHRVPDDVRAGDWLEIGMMGAYSNALRTRFNGFNVERFVEIRDEDTDADRVTWLKDYKVRRVA
ncbi:Ornithine decarboxylase [Caenispirillum salinarum AK4]|uniref:ornithine decarboxylase n=1 Tax=Caenispirillum salinarum AK4 TaxID=1238182 RepID=K9HBZ0_9PROT|nr:type III PLP-dependent enzyme [Caenispirillum salinarum]EKV26281.1 Ornithine decarboxylase [Caenispirillum salinarum AK4]